jgi:hypothetical protein
MFITNIRHQMSIASLVPSLFLPVTISIKLNYSSKIVKNNRVTVDLKYSLVVYGRYMSVPYIDNCSLNTIVTSFRNDALS